eukprot:Lankesteria_metandrocarpae@DN7679_c0_g1_i1.p1
MWKRDKPHVTTAAAIISAPTRDFIDSQSPLHEPLTHQHHSSDVGQVASQNNDRSSVDNHSTVSPLNGARTNSACFLDLAEGERRHSGASPEIRAAAVQTPTATGATATGATATGATA